jgi:hypothetical protein
MGSKVIPKLLYARRLHNLCEMIGWNSKHRNPDDGTDNLWVNLNDVPLNSSLKNNPSVIILNYLQVPIKIMHQPGIHRACTIVQISPMICLDYFSNEIQRSHHNICSEYVPLWDRLPVLHSSPGGCYALIYPLPDPVLRDAWRHISEKKYQEIYAQKKCHKQLELVSLQKKNRHYDSWKMDSSKITHEHQIAQNSLNNWQNIYPNLSSRKYRQFYALFYLKKIFQNNLNIQTIKKHWKEYKRYIKILKQEIIWKKNKIGWEIVRKHEKMQAKSRQKARKTECKTGVVRCREKKMWT